MAVQTSYPTTMDVGAPGQIVNTEANNIISRTVKTAAIPFGRAVIRGAADGTAVLGAAGKFVGISVRDRAVEGTSLDAYPVDASGGFMTQGVIWVTVGEAVAQGDAAGYNATGVLVKAATGTAIANAEFDTSAASSGALAKLRVR